MGSALAALGEPVRVTRSIDGARREPVYMVIARGVPVELGDVPVQGNEVSYRICEAGALVQGDLIEPVEKIAGVWTPTGEKLLLNRELESDGLMRRCIAMAQTG